MIVTWIYMAAVAVPRRRARKPCEKLSSDRTRRSVKMPRCTPNPAAPPWNNDWLSTSSAAAAASASLTSRRPQGTVSEPRCWNYRTECGEVLRVDVLLPIGRMRAPARLNTSRRVWSSQSGKWTARATHSPPLLKTWPPVRPRTACFVQLICLIRWLRSASEISQRFYSETVSERRTGLTYRRVRVKESSPPQNSVIFSLAVNLCNWKLSRLLPKHIPTSTPILVHLSEYLHELYHFY